MSVPANPSPHELHVGNIMGIPVRLSPWFLLLVWVFAARSASWQTAALSLAVFTASVLVHELGHGLVAQHYRLRPRIVLHAFGGYCQHQAPYSRDHDVRIVAAGPGAGLVLAAIAFAAQFIVPNSAPWWVHATVSMLVWQNLFFSLFNLLPILPMDGGSLLRFYLGRSGPQDRADHLTYQIGTAVGATMAVALLVYGEVFIAVLLAMFAWQSHTSSQGQPQRMAMFGNGGTAYARPQATETWRPAPTATRMAGALAALWVLATIVPFEFVDPVYQYGALAPAQVLYDLQLWRPFTYAWLHAPGAWEPLSLSIVALLALGTTLEERRGPRALIGLYAGSAVVAGFVVTMLGAVLPQLFGQVAVGASASTFALFVTWAWLTPRDSIDALVALRLTPKQLVGVVLVADTLMVWVAGNSWDWRLHMAGAAVGWLYSTDALATFAARRANAQVSDRPNAVIIPLPSPEERERLRRKRNDNRPPPDQTIH
jgi:membrane associated rhomboid family serine protease/Zn-dependent protease